jgi:hypothetical protein
MRRGMDGQSPTNIAHSLSGIDFPCNKEDLVEHARKNNADDEVLEILEELPEGGYTNMADVMKSYGEAREHSD